MYFLGAMVGLSYAGLLIHEIKDISLSLDILSRNSEAADEDMYPSYLHPPFPIDLAKRSHYLGWIWLRVPLAAWMRGQGEYQSPAQTSRVPDETESVRAWWGEVYLQVGRNHVVTRLESPGSRGSRLLLRESVQDQVRLILWESNGLAALLDAEEDRFEVLASPGRAKWVHWPEWHWTRPPAPPFDELVELVLERLAGNSR